MSEAPLSPYRLATVIVHASAGTPSKGYGVTRMSDGTYATATTSNLGSSTTGTVDGIAIADGTANKQLQVCTIGRLDTAYVVGSPSGAVGEAAVVDSTGKLQRASAGAGVFVGSFDARGDVALTAIGGQADAYSFWARALMLRGGVS
jgi:hypothetical protein